MYDEQVHAKSIILSIWPQRAIAGSSSTARVDVAAQVSAAKLLRSYRPVSTTRMNRHSSKEASLASPCRTSLTLNEEEHEERDALLENITWNEKKGSDESGPHKLRRNLLIYVIGILSLSNLICIAVISIICLHRSPPEIASRPSWAPPERYETRLFEYVDAYGGEPGPESEAAWTDLIPGTSCVDSLLITRLLCSFKLMKLLSMPQSAKAGSRFTMRQLCQ